MEKYLAPWIMRIHYSSCSKRDQLATSMIGTNVKPYVSEIM